jgi:arylsulfatase A-like enzyme
MNVVFISIDSLKRHYLPAYGQTIEYPVATPNLDRFARRAAVFEAHYAGSLPCMPARREFFAGVQEFLWRPWGPIEAYDMTLARAARAEGVMTQLVTDHFHFFQHGSHGYFEDYHGFEFIRGHEFDAWRTAPREPDPRFLAQIKAERPNDPGFMNRVAYARNATALRGEEDFFGPRVFAGATDWLRANHDHPRWLLVIDSFDVHEPFHCPEPYASMYTDEDPRDPEMILWPYYGRIDAGQSRLSERQVAFVRAQYAGKLTMVDRWFGRLLDALDDLALWETTAVIVTTDHGHYLGDHGWVGKPDAPLFNVLAHTPLFIWWPGGPLNGGRTGALTSAIDLHATILDGLGVATRRAPHSRSLAPLLAGAVDRHRDWALYGYWGSSVNVTDGRHTYLHPGRTDLPTYCYSTTMMRPYGWFTPLEARADAEAGRFLPYADAPVWRYPAPSLARHAAPLLFDARADPGQVANLAGRDAAEERRMRDLLATALRELQAPAEQYERLGLTTG